MIVAFPFVEKNPWKGVFTYFIPIFCNLLLAFTGITLLMAVYKLSLLILEKGFQRSIAQIVLWLNVICLSLRCAYLASNPMGAYGGTSFLWVQFGATLPFSFCISGTLLITLYWHEMILRAGHQINLFLSSMLIPFLIACGVIFGIEIASVIVRGLNLLIPVVIIVDASIYAAVVLSLLIFFIVTKVRLSKEFKRLNRTLNLQKGKKLAIASNIVIGIAVVMVLWLAAMLFLAAGKYFWSPPGFALTWIILLTSMTTLCLLQILLIRAPWRPWRWILCGVFKSKPQLLYVARHGTFSSSLGSVSHSKSNQTSRDMGSAELGSLETGTNSASNY